MEGTRSESLKLEKSHNKLLYERARQNWCLPNLKISISNTMTRGKLVIKCPRKPREDLQQRVKNKKYDTIRSRVAWLLFFTRCDVFCDLLQYTHTGKCNIFVLYNKNSNGLLKNFRGMEKEKQVCWRDLTWIWRHLCVYFNRSRSTLNNQWKCTQKSKKKPLPLHRISIPYF